MSNKQITTFLSCCVGFCMFTGAAVAQVDSTQPATPSDGAKAITRHDTSMTTGQFLRSKDLVGANVKDSAGKKLGDIRELYLNPQDGVAFATIDISGSRDAVVPVQALKVTHSKGVLKDTTEITINKTEAELTSGATITESEWNKLNDPNFTHQIYGAYNLQMPAAMGGAETPGGTSTGKTPPEQK